MFVEDIKNFADGRQVVIYGLFDHTDDIIRVLKYNGISPKYVVTAKKKPPPEVAGVPVRGSFDEPPPLVYCVFTAAAGVKALLRKHGIRKDTPPPEPRAAVTDAADTADMSEARPPGGGSSGSDKAHALSGVLGYLSVIGKAGTPERSANSSPGRDYTVVERDYIRYDSELCGAFVGRYAAGIREHADVIGKSGLIRSVGRYTCIDPAAVFGGVRQGRGSLTLCGEFLRDIGVSGVTADGGVRIGNDVYIGANAFIDTSVCRVIGDGAVIAANAVITADVRPYAVMGGNPAKVERFRFLRREIELLNRIRWWDFDDEKLAANADCFADYHLLLERFG
ncbi:hypothetical protein FACS1894133_6290 [Clostridia bacterium]|nr:hypothetical protein FACS1894133_6290 [Clostridia bacterium]